MKYVSPAIDRTAFNCPHCGALAKQFWHTAYVKRMDEENPLPTSVNDDFDPSSLDLEENEKRALIVWFEKMRKNRPFFDTNSFNLYSPPIVFHLNISRCFNCDDIAIWIGEKMVYPVAGEAPEPNPDLPEDILEDYREASVILDLSPRGAAALVRLCIQKLCKELGQPGKNINDDIAALVANGLDSRIQKALDAVRVIGNNAVHPGNMDLSDDRATAESLFRLLNLIAEKMISEPKHVDEVYALLPPGARAAIEARDKKGRGG